MNQTIFITGASTGLGKAAAILFAQKGWNVIATMRQPQHETELTQYPHVQLMQLDVTDAAQIEATVKQAAAAGKVDVVFNNAGYGLVGPFEGTTDEQMVTQLNTNLLGVMRVTKAFLPYFRQQGSGLFITTTSIGGLVTFPFNSVYHATKWALEGWSESLAFEAGRFGIGVKTVSPGGISTDFIGRSLVLAKHEAYDGLVNTVLSKFTNPERMKSYSTPAQIAAVVYEAATDGKKQLRYVAGEDAKGIYAQREQLGVEPFRASINEAFFQ